METRGQDERDSRWEPVRRDGQLVRAGPGIAPRAAGSPRRAGRSASNYAHLVARDLGLDLHDVTYSGATTEDILRSSAGGQPAQLDAVTRATRLVTLTAGGNDVGYLPRLTRASLPWPLRVLPRARAQVAGFGDPAATDERFASLGRNLQAIARGVADRAPDCRILFVDYLTILPPAGSGARPQRRAGAGPATPPPAAIADWGRVIAGRLAATTQEAAEAAGAGYVAASAASAGHHAWSARALDAAVPPLAARRGAVPPQRGRDGGGRVPRAGRPRRKSRRARMTLELGGQTAAGHGPGELMTLEIRRLHLAALRGPDGRDWPVHGFVIIHPGGAALVDTGAAARTSCSATGGWSTAPPPTPWPGSG